MCVVYAAKFWSNVLGCHGKVMYVVKCLPTAHLFFPRPGLLTLQVHHYISALMSSPSDKRYVLRVHLCAHEGGAA